jgi:hypothetical protein
MSTDTALSLRLVPWCLSTVGRTSSVVSRRTLPLSTLRSTGPRASPYRPRPGVHL